MRLKREIMFKLQGLEVMYLIEWWENYALPHNKSVLSTYEPGWEDRSIFDDLSEEYVRFAVECSV